MKRYYPHVPVAASMLVLATGTLALPGVADGACRRSALALDDSTLEMQPPLHIWFPGGLPFRIDPEVPLELSVTIVPGTQGIVPGSPRVHYRSQAGGVFGSVPLRLIGGDEYFATLPGFVCGDRPELYFSAQGDGGTIVTLPETAPQDLYRTEAGIMVVDMVLEQLFPTAWPAPGWYSTGMWDVNEYCLPAGPNCATGPAAYFGRHDTCMYDLPPGSPRGTLFTHVVQLPTVPPGGAIVVRFCHALETENHPLFDKAMFGINGQTRPEWRLPESDPWSEAVFDLTEFAGQGVQLSWEFDAVNSGNNQFRGWHLNHVRIEADAVGCEPEPCYADCYEPEIAELTIDDMICFIHEMAQAKSLPHEEQRSHYANCDGSSAAPVLNVDDFTCFINEFAQGCP